MPQYPIIHSTRTPEGDFVRVILEDGEFEVQEVNKDSRPLRALVAFTLDDALYLFARKVSNKMLEPLLETLLLPVGKLFVIQTERKGEATEDVNIFHTQEAYDAFRRSQLSRYERQDDAQEVAKLLAEGDLEGAWEMATSDDLEEKEPWDTYFGYHRTEMVPNFAPFDQLPEWLQKTIRVTLK